MGYLKIPNLYQDQDILLFRECYALEKIHGTSAHLKWHEGKLTFFSGGETHEKFVNLFDADKLARVFTENFATTQCITVFGEAYGGKQQGMSATYGPNLKFIVFDVKVDDLWLSVPKAHNVADKLELEFVDYVRISTDLTLLDEQRDRESTQAIRNGMGFGKVREGVILRPIVEVIKNSGARMIAKHKCAAFSEHSKPRKVETDESKRQLQTDAIAIADDWVTPMRLSHVIDKMKANGEEAKDMRDTPRVIRAMLEDIKAESVGEIDWSSNDQIERAINSKAAKVWKAHVCTLVNDT